LYSDVATALSVVAGTTDTADAITETIEAKLLDLQSTTVTTQQIADVTLSTLKHFDTPAFLRYLASHGDVRSTREANRQLRRH
jgi:transcriptional regulator NrdR family protein